MKEAKKKLKAFDIIMIVILVIVIIAFMIPLRSCLPYKHGDFKYYQLEEKIEITDLSRSGKKKKNIIIPDAINGRKVTCLGETDYLLGGCKGRWKSDDLEKLYMNFDRPIPISQGLVGNKTCPKLKKIIAVYHLGKNYLTDEKIFYSYSNWVIEEYKEEMSSHHDVHPANVTFYLNYDVKEGEREYHWIDDIEDGEKIEVVPPVPKRAGYKFGGWYKEQECINKWDFAKDTVEKVKVDRTNYTEFVENKLYAKWMKD